MKRRFEAGGPLRGRVTPPPDKSISHRAALFAAMTDEPVRIENYLRADDTMSTLDAIRSLGAGIEEQNGIVLVRGVGLRTAAPTTGEIHVRLRALAARAASRCVPAPASSARNSVLRVNMRPGTRTPFQPGA